MGTLILNTKVVKDVEIIDEGEIVKFILPLRYLNYEKGLIENLKKSFKTSLFEKLLINYNTIYYFDGKAFEYCLPLSIKTKKGKSVISFMYSSEINIKYLQKFTDSFAKSHRLPYKKLEEFWFR